jgi:small-conductance mechanosensitive channel
MRTMYDYVVVHWLDVIPLAVFAVSIIALFWLRKIALEWLEKWSKKISRSIGNILIPSLSGPFSILCLVLSIYLAITAADIPDRWKTPASCGLWSLFVIAITSTLLNLTTQFILYYSRKFKLTKRLTMITRNVTNVIILVVALLTILTIWGITPSPVLLLIAMVILIGLIAFRDTAPNLFASFQIAAAQEIKIGDYVKLDTCEEGYVSELSWNTTHLKSLDGSMILIPNHQYQREVVKGKEFYFMDSVSVILPTTYIAHDLRELVESLRKISPDSLYFHIFESRLRLDGDLNDFAVWLDKSMAEPELSREVASIDPYAISLKGIRSSLVQAIEKRIK